MGIECGGWFASEAVVAVGRYAWAGEAGSEAMSERSNGRLERSQIRLCNHQGEQDR